MNPFLIIKKNLLYNFQCKIKKYIYQKAYHIPWVYSIESVRTRFEFLAQSMNGLRPKIMNL